MVRNILLFGFACILSLNVLAQQDTSIVELQALPEDSTTEKTHSPKTAALLSTFIPGAGQIYNGSWWKTPIVYVGFAGIGYGLYFYQDYYKSFKTAYNDYRNPYLEQGLTPPADTILTVHRSFCN